MRAILLVLSAAAAFVGGCSRDGSTAGRGGGGGGEGAVASLQGSDCGHTSCGSNFFIDAAQSSDCAPGANCAIAISLVATGEFHINDDYPYKFRADDAPHLTFQGTDPAGPNVFSKLGSNWHKMGPQKGTMSVVFQSAEKGTRNVSGTFKLSVCSAHNCQLEQTSLTTPVSVR